MSRLFLSSLLLLLPYSAARATEITHETLVGNYNIIAIEGPMRILLKMNVMDGSQFDIQRVYEDGTANELCKGSYTLKNQAETPFQRAPFGNVFLGVFSCPSRPSSKASVSIEFKQATIEDLINGTQVTMTSSYFKNPFRKTYIQKQ